MLGRLLCRVGIHKGRRLLEAGYYVGGYEPCERCGK